MKIIGTTDLTAEASRSTGASRLTGLAPTLSLIVAVQCITLTATWWLLGAGQWPVLVVALLVGTSSTVALFVWGVRRKIHDPLDRLLAAMARLRDIDSGVFDGEAASRSARVPEAGAMPPRLAHVFVGHEAAVDHLVVERARAAQARAELRDARAALEAARSRADGLAQPSGELAEARRRAFRLAERVERLVDVWSVARRETVEVRGAADGVGAELASEIASDLRGSIEAILGFTELTLKTQKGLNARGSANLNRALRAAHEIRVFLDDLATVADVGWTRERVAATDADEEDERPEGMRDVTRHEISPSLVTEEFDVAKLIDSCVAAVEPLSTGKSIEYDIRVDESLARVRQDRAKIARIVDGLLAHAVRFSTGGAIRLRATAESGRVTHDDRVMKNGGTTKNGETTKNGASAANGATAGILRIAVEGTGHAVPPNARDRCFEAFAPVDPTALSAGGALGGAGLGLYVVRSVARQLEGEAYADFEDGDESRATIGVVVPLLAILQPATIARAKTSRTAKNRGAGKRAGAS